MNSKRSSLTAMALMGAALGLAGGMGGPGFAIKTNTSRSNTGPGKLGLGYDVAAIQTHNAMKYEWINGQCWTRKKAQKYRDCGERLL